MVTTTITKTTQEFITAFNSHNVEKVLSLSNPDFTIEDVGTGQIYHGMQEARKYFSDFFKAFPDIRMEVKTDFRSGDWAANEWILTGTNTGNLTGKGNMPEIPATNKKINFKGATILQYRDNKVSRETSYWNMAAFMQELGLMPAMPGK